MGLDNIWHVVPISDTKEHKIECIAMSEVVICGCECIPKTINESNGVVIVHNSFDGREGIEWANEILKNN